MIDFQSSATNVLLNPRTPEETRAALQGLVESAPELGAHVWIASSGSTGRLRMVALSKNAMLASAAAVNEHLRSTADDVWCRPLPAFHVGGLGIEARAHLLGNRVHELESWDPDAFLSLAGSAGVTLSSFVPAQLHDLVQRGRRAPRSLRAIVIGGGALSQSLYRSARALGWNVLPSYGMTECCSQIATAALRSLDTFEDPALELLPHLKARTEPDGRLSFSGTSLLTGEAVEGEGFRDPKIGGWFISDDLGELSQRDGATILLPLGRTTDTFKVGGELVSLARLDAILRSIVDEAKGVDAALFTAPDPRLGTILHLVVDDAARAEEILHRFNGAVLPYERARAVHVGSIPRSPLAKLLRDRLRSQFV